MLKISLILLLFLTISFNSAFGAWWDLQDDNEDYCYDLFVDATDFLQNIIFYIVIFDLEPTTNFEEGELPPDLQKSLLNNRNLLESDFIDNNCEEYRYLVDEDEYLNWRFLMIDYHFSLLEYHNIEFHQQSKIGQYLDEIEEHKDLIKFFLPLIF